MKKMDLLLKIAKRDYKNELEEILEEKKFSSNTKNLLLSMIYKIEQGYKDYKYIKRNSLTEGQIIEDIIKIIENKCEKIELVEPYSKKGKVLARYGVTSISNASGKNIISYPVEKDLLYAICNIEKDIFKINDKYYLANLTLSKLLRMGNCINCKEIIRDFDGWTWNIENRDIDSFEYNIIYQNLRILLGDSFLFEWKNDKQNEKDYLNDMKNILIDKYGEKNADEFYNLCILNSIAIKMSKDNKLKSCILEDKIKITKEYKSMVDKAQFLEKMTKERKKINIEIKKIDRIINNKKLLERELQRINQMGENIANVGLLKLRLKKQRNDLMIQLKNYANLINPKKYMQNLSELSNKNELLEKIDINIASQEWISDHIIQLQKMFLNCIKNKIQTTKIKQELIEFIYHIRYYNKIALRKEKEISQIDELQKSVEEVENILIIKCINLKVINIVSKNGNYNIEIIKRTINSKIINLENIQIEIMVDYNKLHVSVYDGEILENEFEIATNSLIEKSDVKINKRIKLFT